MPRPALPDAPQTLVGDVIPYDTATESRVRQAMAEVLDRAQIAADQLGYEGPLTIEALDDAVYVYQRRTVEDCIQLGRLLVVRKELTPHGEWLPTVERLGFSERTARRFMQAALKASKSATVADLARQVRSAGRYLELLTLDDEEISALADGGTAAGLTLDDVDRMSVSELRRRLRDARAESAAKDKILGDKSTRIDQLQTKIEAAKQQERDAKHVPLVEPDAAVVATESRLTHLRASIEINIRGPFKATARELIDTAVHAGADVGEVVSGQIAQLRLALGEVLEELGVKFSPDGETEAEWVHNPDIWIDADEAKREH